MERRYSRNLVYKGTARNFNPMMATAGKITIAEVEELVPLGELDPNQIHTHPEFMCNEFFRVRIMRNELNNVQ
jgi:acyl CoA:acetate/3-ketoacid CoA transferase alpha subunit